MNANKKYVIYELNNVMDSQRHKALEKVELSGFKSNSFETEEEAIQALIDEEKKYEDFVILTNVFITDF